VLLAARELLDAPDHRVLVRYVLDSTNVGAEDGRVDIRRHGHNDLDIVRDGLGFELGLCLDDILDL